MDYLFHYCKLMDRARARASTRKGARALLGYVERHRILPGCLGGEYTEDNIAFLTGEEHYVAHQLLVKIYPNNNKLVFATTKMAKRATGNKAYGWLRRRHAQMLKGHPRWGPSTKGIPKSLETRRKMGAWQIGRKRPPFSAKARAAMSAGHKGKSHTPEHRANLAASHTPERRQRSSLLLKGKKRPLRSPEHSLAISDAHAMRKLYFNWY